VRGILRLSDSTVDHKTFQSAARVQLLGVGDRDRARFVHRERILGLPTRVEEEIADLREVEGGTGFGTRGVPHRTEWTVQNGDRGAKLTYGVEPRLPPVLHQLPARFLARECRRIIRDSHESLLSPVASQVPR
jgi:hypothetical protein